jgi:extracellular factor (EF) 3-hydroxypalmitic acid methyl ester biosynthesis protein
MNRFTLRRALAPLRRPGASSETSPSANSLMKRHFLRLSQAITGFVALLFAYARHLRCFSPAGFQQPPWAKGASDLVLARQPAISTMTRMLLDHVHADLVKQPRALGAALDALSWHLRTLKRELSTQQWRRAIAVCREHPLSRLVYQDPLTARAFAMSRGYQGDAELLDIIYTRDYRPFRSEPVTALGDAIFRHTIQCQAPSAVRERRQFLAGQIDSVCTNTSSPHILSVACGHLRELEVSRAGSTTRPFARFVGLDQDPSTLAFVAQTWGHLGVKPQRASVKAFMSSAPPADRFHFIYVAGLYDYLDDTSARHVTAKLFAMLHPGGRLLVGNYTPDTDDAGYMEAYMNWHLLYRDALAMERLTAGVRPERIADSKTFCDSTGAVIYLDIKSR